MSIVNGSDDDWMLDDSEKVEALQEMSGIRPWKILIVDDEPDVHSMTKLALRDMH